MRLHLGTSGFSYGEWKGKFYPPKMKAREMLAFYATRFSACEINNTFYRMPTAETFAPWLAEVPKDFCFALKAPQRITHQKRLVGVKALVAEFVAAAETVGPRLGPLLFQLPPHLPLDLPKLEGLLELLPQGLLASAEFRHLSWFAPEVFACLRAHNIALCWEQSEEIESPFESTSSYGYLRLRRLDYTDKMLRNWVKRIQAQPWTDAFVFFKHEDEASGPRFAERFQSLWDA